MPKSRIKKFVREPRVFVITDHALEALGKRMNRQHAHLGPRQLGDLLDRDLRDREESQKETWWERYDGDLVQTTVYRLHHFTANQGDQAMFAITRPGKDRKTCVVTVLTEEMVFANKSNGRWGRTAEEVGKPMLRQGLLDSMDDAKFAELHEQARNVVPRARADRKPVLKKIEGGKKEETVAEPEQMLVMWETSDTPDGKSHMVCKDHSTMHELVTKLALDPYVENDTIAVYKKQSVMITIDVSVAVG